MIPILYVCIMIAVAAGVLRAQQPDSLRITLPGLGKKLLCLMADRLRDPRGRSIGNVFVFHDITTRERSEKALQNASWRLETMESIINQGPVALFLWRIEPDKWPVELVSDNVERILGYSADDFLSGRVSWPGITHPDDVPRLEAEVGRYLEQGVREWSQEYRLITKAGDIRWMKDWNTVLSDSSGELTHIQAIIMDITARKRAEAELKQRASFELLVSEVSSNFVALSPDEIDAGIDRALAAIGKFTGADRAYVFQFYDSNALMDNTHEWCAEGIEPQITNLQALPSDSLPWWMAKLNRSETIHIPNVADLPPEADAEKEILQAQEIRSLLVVPMKLGERLIGFLGFDAVRDSLSWSDDDQSLLRLVGETIAHVLVRSEAERALQLHSQDLALINTVNAALNRGESLPEIIRLFSEEAKRVFDCTTANVYLVSEDREFMEILRLDLTPDQVEQIEKLIGISIPELRIPLRQGGLFQELLSREEPALLNDAEAVQEWIMEFTTATGLPETARRGVRKRVPQIQKLIGIYSLISVPLRLNSRPVGLLSIAHQEAFTAEEVKRLAGIAGQVTAAIQRARADETIRDNARQFEALYETARELAGEQDLTALLDSVVKRAAALFDTTVGGIYLYEAEPGELVMSAMTGFNVPIGIRLRLGEGMAGRVAQSREVLNIEDYRTWEGRSPQYEGTPFSSILQVPMLYAGELVGVLAVGEIAPKTRQFTEADERLLSLFAASAAGAVRSARLFEAARRRNRALAALYETSLAVSGELERGALLQRLSEQVQTVLGPDAFLLSLLDANTGEIEVKLAIEEGQEVAEWVGKRFPMDGGGLTGWIIREQKPLLVSDMEADSLPAVPKHVKRPARSWLGVPLVMGARTLGAMAVQSFSPEAFDEGHQRLMESLARQTAIALENARLFEQAKRRMERIETLRIIDQAISSSLDLNVTLNVLLNQVMDQLGADAAAVLTYQPELQTLKYFAGRGFRTTALQFTNLRLGQSHAGLAALERHPVFIADLGERETGFLRSPQFKSEGFVSYYSVPLLAKGQIMGVMEIFQRSRLHPDREWTSFARTMAGQAAIAIDNLGLFNKLQRSNVELTRAYDATIEGWARALELRDQEIEGHSRRVTKMTLRLAETLGVSQEQSSHIRRGALLHDIGKMGIPDAILQKQEPLTEEEWAIMRQHPVYSRQMLMGIEYLRPAIDIPYCHHEKWDGSGYPRGLEGERIPLAARIFAVVDVWDALTSERPYRDAWPEEEALAYIQEQAGKHFDPQVVEAFLKIIA